MKHLFVPILLSISIFIYSCANQGTPTGGPKDTIPPTLISSNPIDQTTNFSNQSFTFTFDEMITTEKLKQKLVITPFTEIKYKIKPKKESFTIEFEEAFEDSTTYTFNFADGVTDVTEKNPVDNFSFAFSTGPIIDSISINGTVRDLFSNEKAEQALIALFDSTDTLNIFDGKPKYFATTNETGYYQIKNIKNGLYKIYAFIDDNNNLKCEPEEEAHGFKSGFIDLNDSKDSVNLQVQLIDSSPFNFVRAKTTGRYYDVLFNKFVKSYEIIKIEESNLTIPDQNLIKENKILRFYPAADFKIDQDSLQLRIETLDSLGNNSIDTVFVKFTESKRKPEKFEGSLKPNNGTSINKELNLILSFSKPIIKYNYDSISINYDTLVYQQIPDSLFTWNHNQTEIKWKLNLDPSFFPNYLDSLTSRLDSLLADSTTFDSTFLNQKHHLKRVKSNSLSISVPQSAFVSIDQDSSNVISNTYKFTSQEDAGSISGSVSTDIQSYIVQLVDKNFNVVASQKNPAKYQFNFIKPGDYTLRVLIDENNDGRWSPGNILTDKEPEPIWFWGQTTTIRNNFILENNNIQF